MRYLGNKTKLLHFIESVINKYHIEGEVFADFFAGSGSVSDYFKERYQIVANDYMYFSKILTEAKVLNNEVPDFSHFVQQYGMSPYDYLNNADYTPNDNYFIYHNFTPQKDRMYLTESNAIKIDGIRLKIEELYKEGLFDYKEYTFLLASLLESITKVSNTTGTYQAFLKFWESRALKPLTLEPLEMRSALSVDQHNEVLCENANAFARRMSGDIAYLDPPYTITQYTNSYHLLETVARYDYPELFGKTGRRVNRELSGYSNKKKALMEFEDLFRQIDFTHVLMSYSNQSLVPLEELIELAKLFAVDQQVFVETYDYREYATNNASHKGNGKGLKEVIIYFKKDRQIHKSPLNYSGSKDVLLPKITKYLPKHVPTFVDAMGGAFNVGANIVATEKIVYNEYNPFVYGIMNMLLTTSSDAVIEQVQSIVERFELQKKAKEPYLALRDFYNNEDNSPIYLYTLQIYAFQNMIRFNNSHKMNTPIGNNEFNDGTIQRLRNFKVRAKALETFNDSYKMLPIERYSTDTVFYFDPPYFITKAEYNDGKRGLDGWDAEKETELLQYLTMLDQKGYKFMLSNVTTHRDKVHHLLLEWVASHGYHLYEIGQTGIKYPRTEVLITNYNYLEKY